MIITQTPYRIGLTGGGTDLPAFCEREPGAVVNVAINRHFYVSVCPRFAGDWRVAYSRTETVAARQDIAHDIVRAALINLDIARPLEIAMTGELPAGNGLGSSSAVAVGLLTALAELTGRPLDEEQAAAQACRLELDWLGKVMGRQDQYGCALGGFKLLRFHPGGRVEVRRLAPPAAAVADLEACCLILFIGTRGPNGALLRHQDDRAAGNLSQLRRLRDLALETAAALEAGAGVPALADLIAEGWRLKRSLSPLIADEVVDGLLARARRLGAWGGKLLGAGGRGFLLVLAPPDTHGAIAERLGRPPRLPFAVAATGTRVLYHKPEAWSDAS